MGLQLQVCTVDTLHYAVYKTCNYEFRIVDITNPSGQVAIPAFQIHTGAIWPMQAILTSAAALVPLKLTRE